MPEAFVLVKTEPSHERDVYLALTSHDAVKEVHALYGEFDLLARVQADDEFTLTRCIVEEIRPLDGIQDTKTMIGAEL